MKDLYAVFHVPYKASLLEITKAYFNQCLKNPSSCFYYTKIFKILACTPYKMMYDSLFFQIDIRTMTFFQVSLSEEEEYELAHVIALLEYFMDLVYDSKYFYQHSNYLNELDSWYNELVSIIDDLKRQIKSFYLS